MIEKIQTEDCSDKIDRQSKSISRLSNEVVELLSRAEQAEADRDSIENERRRLAEKLENEIILRKRMRVEEVDSCQNCSCCSYKPYEHIATCEADDFTIHDLRSIHKECPLRNGPMLLRLKEGV
jgi:predicted RNase H-like nuclease (RuvC/YqgF family)